ncbi:MAG: hypothetical protein ABSB91_03335 [Sedimentisphaerales bacterium]
MRIARSIQNDNRRRGSAGIILIIILVIAAVIFGVQKWGKSKTPDPDTAQNLMPWKEWRLREQSPKPVPPPGDKQAQITKTLKYDANVELAETKEPRGEIQMIISPDGAVLGEWSGTYYNSKKDNFDVQGGKFNGKIYPGKIYQDEKGQDPAKLYFLAKGQFLIHHMAADTNKYHVLTGDLYVTGWLNPDFSIASDITITSDEKYSQVFHWQAGRPAKD